MKKNINKADRFTRYVFGILLVGSFFLGGAKWMALILGGLFLISAATTFCITCEFYKKFIGKCEECEIIPSPKSKIKNQKS